MSGPKKRPFLTKPYNQGLLYTKPGVQKTKRMSASAARNVSVGKSNHPTIPTPMTNPPSLTNRLPLAGPSPSYIGLIASLMFINPPLFSHPIKAQI